MFKTLFSISTTHNIYLVSIFDLNSSPGINIQSQYIFPVSIIGLNTSACV